MENVQHNTYPAGNNYLINLKPANITYIHIQIYIHTNIYIRTNIYIHIHIYFI